MIYRFKCVFSLKKRHIYLQVIVTRLPRSRKLSVTNTGLFNSHHWAPPLLLLFCQCDSGAFLSILGFVDIHFYYLGSTPMVSFTQTVNRIQWELSWTEAAKMGFWYYLNELCSFFNITIHSEIPNVSFFKYLSKQISKIIYTVQSIFK